MNETNKEDDQVTHRKYLDQCKHACYLFKQLEIFRKRDILCDVDVTRALQVTPAHKIVLLSARHSSGEFPALTNDSNSHCSEDDVFTVDEVNSTGKDNENLSEEEIAENLRQRLVSLNELWRRRCCCDVTLVADNCRCVAHKVVLAASSDYFRAMFTNSMKESDMSTIALKGVNGAFFRRTLDFIYTGELMSISYEDTMELLKVAVFYQIIPMIECCANILLRNVSSAAVCVLYAAAKDLALNNVAEQCSSYIHDHFLEMDSADSHVDLLLPDDLAMCLRSEQLGGGSSNSRAEASILTIVLRWLFVNRKISPAIQNEIISHIRFVLIHPDDILTRCQEVASFIPNCDTNMTPYSIMFSFGSVFKSHAIHAMVYHERVYTQPLLQTPISSLRTSEEKWVIVDGVLAQNPVKLPSGSRHIIPLLSGTRDSDDVMKCRDPFHSVVELNGFIYVIGGTRNYSQGYSRVMFRYDPRLDECISVASMNEKRGDFVACVFNEHIFVFGGRNRHGVLSSCECYNPLSNTWEYISDLPQPIYMAAGLRHQDSIYISGGFNSYETVEGMLRYIPILDNWVQIQAPMRADRGYHVMTKGHDDRLWVVGGVDNPFAGRNVWEVEAFDLDAQMWFFVGQVLPVKLFEHTIRLNALLRDDRICVFAVTDPEKYPIVEYDPSKRMWLRIKNSLEICEIIAEP